MTQQHPVSAFNHATLVGHPHEHDGLVLRIARRFTWALKQGALEFTDLVQAGRTGVLKAKAKYDPAFGTAFSTYATFWIMQHMRRLVQNEGSTIRIPVGQQVRRRAAGQTSSFYTRIALEQPGSDGAELNLLDVLCPTLPDDESPDRAELARKVQAALMRLPVRERTVLVVRFFRDGTLKDAGDEFGFSREFARQLEARGLAMLKAELTGVSWRSLQKNSKSYNAKKRERYNRLREVGYSGRDAKNESGSPVRYREALRAKGLTE
jgi:RNA polymerase sigma factor (sigma-70 family)